MYNIWQVEKETECDEDDDWEYVEVGPAEIIWQGNEIIIKKKKERIPKKDANQLTGKEVPYIYHQLGYGLMVCFLFFGSKSCSVNVIICFTGH